MDSRHFEWLSYVLGELGTSGIELISEYPAATLRAYFRPECRPEDLCRRLRKTWQDCRLPAESLRILSIAEIAPRNWVGEWRTQYRPIRVGKRFLIVPSWNRHTTSPGRHKIRLDPQNAFGSGTHASTRLCLLGIEEYYRPGWTAIDVGTGSGILAIAMAALNPAGQAEPAPQRLITAIDSDPEAVATARKNARRNGLSRLIRFLAVPAEHWRRAAYTFLVANLTCTDLQAQAAGLTSLCRPGSILLLAGLQRTDAVEVRRAFQARGCKPLKTRIQEGWALLVMQKLTNTPRCCDNQGS